MIFVQSRLFPGFFLINVALCFPGPPSDRANPAGKRGFVRQNQVGTVENEPLNKGAYCGLLRPTMRS